MRTRYQSPEDYRQFTGYEMFQGTIAQAQGSGYTFADTFVSVADGAREILSEQIRCSPIRRRTC